MIDSYSFGSMTIGGREFRKDLIILPDGTIIHPWWRESGHRLVFQDIEPVIEASPDELVVGTGDPGMMEPDPDLVAGLEAKGIRVQVLPTAGAVQEFNSLTGSDRRIAACFHLTC